VCVLEKETCKACPKKKQHFTTSDFQKYFECCGKDAVNPSTSTTKCEKVFTQTTKEKMRWEDAEQTEASTNHRHQQKKTIA
jgi:hypothetical protein